MSTFGEYVHLYWKNYKELGPVRLFKERKNQNNFSLSIFDSHKEDVQKKINHISISPDKLKKLETEYNDKLQ